MLIFKKQELEALILNIGSVDTKTGKLIGGLLTESLSLGDKRILKKLRDKAVKFYQELLEDIKEVKTACGDDKDKLEKEILTLLGEEVKIDSPKIKFSSLEGITTSQMYDFEIIEKFSQ